MSIASEMTALAANRDAIKSAIEAKGGTVSSNTLAAFPAAISALPSGGGMGFFVGPPSVTTGGGDAVTITVDGTDYSASDFLNTPLRVFSSPDTISFRSNYWGTDPLSESECILRYADGTTQTILANTTISPTQSLAMVEWHVADCLDPDTSIMMADGSYKRVFDVTAGDMVATPLGPDIVVEASQGSGKAVDIWTFEDGSEVRTVGRHRFFNLELSEPMYLEAWNAGERAVRSDGVHVALVGRKTESGEHGHATIFTERWNLYYANGLLAGNRRSRGWADAQSLAAKIQV